MQFEKLEKHYCQFGVPSSYHPRPVDCGEPAEFVVWWSEDKSDKMFVCEEHFNTILEAEESGEDGDNLK